MCQRLSRGPFPGGFDGRTAAMRRWRKYTARQRVAKPPHHQDRRRREIGGLDVARAEHPSEPMAQHLATSEVRTAGPHAHLADLNWGSRHDHPSFCWTMSNEICASDLAERRRHSYRCSD